MSELIVEFLSEATEDLQTLDQKLVALEANPTKLCLVDDIFRVIHSIKGTCGFFKFSKLEEVAHAIEDILVKFKNLEIAINQDIISIIFESIDAIKYIVLYIEKNGKEPIDDYSDLIKKIWLTLSRANHSSSDEGGVVESQSFIQDHSSKTIRVNVDALENLMQTATDLVLNRNQLLHLDQGSVSNDVSLAIDKLDSITTKLQQSIMETRLQPIKNSWVQLPRFVRDLSSKLNKKIKLIMKGGATQLDKQLIEAIKSPMMHMLRNAVDHGIEYPEERIKKGKPEEGVITISARHSSGNVVVEVIDDGIGVSVSEIKQKILKKNIVNKSEVSLLSDEQVLQYVFHPGISTAKEVTNISGRGVGMSVVRENIRDLHGEIKLSSVKGEGSLVEMTIPLTLAIMPSLLIEVSGVKFALPEINVLEVVSLSDYSRCFVESESSGYFASLRGLKVPCLFLYEVLKLPRGNPEFVIICKVKDEIYGVVIDRFYDIEEIVLKPMSKLIEFIEVYMGNALLGNNEIVLMLSPLNIMKYCASSPVLIKEDKQEIPVALTKFLLFQIQGKNKAIALDSVVKVKNITSDDVFSLKGKKVIKYQESIVPILFSNEFKSFSKEVEYIGLIIKFDNKIFLQVVDKVVEVIDNYTQEIDGSILVTDIGSIEVVNLRESIEGIYGR